MSKTVIKVENLSKLYIINHQQMSGYKTFRETLVAGTKKIGKNIIAPFKARKALPATKEEFWALQNISLEIKQGERVGIIGGNGAGKSTLLKILSRIVEPTKGSISIKGRIASLLEVGTGFHPELTGRENIFLNGAILGMGRNEIKRKFDEIVAFSEVEKFLDTPVKRYSSGMYVRLAFAVAAHMEPEILVVDEVLAVGDAAFQKKCLGKMEDVSKNDGRTVIFVSHNMSAISSLCNKGIILQKGNILFSGEVQEAVRRYATDLSVVLPTEWTGNEGDDIATLKHVWVQSLDKDKHFHTAADIEIGIELDVHKPINGLIMGFTLFSEFQYELAYVLYDDDKAPPSEIVIPGKIIKKFIIPKNTLAQGTYKVEFDIGVHMLKKIVSSISLSFTLENTEGFGRRFITPNLKGRAGIFRPKWSIE